NDFLHPIIPTRGHDHGIVGHGRHRIVAIGERLLGERRPSARGTYSRTVEHLCSPHIWVLGSIGVHVRHDVGLGGTVDGTYRCQEQVLPVPGRDQHGYLHSTNSMLGSGNTSVVPEFKRSLSRLTNSSRNAHGSANRNRGLSARISSSDTTSNHVPAIFNPCLAGFLSAMALNAPGQSRYWSRQQPLVLAP